MNNRSAAGTDRPAAGRRQAFASAVVSLTAAFAASASPIPLFNTYRAECQRPVRGPRWWPVEVPTPGSGFLGFVDLGSSSLSGLSHAVGLAFGDHQRNANGLRLTSVRVGVGGRAGRVVRSGVRGSGGGGSRAMRSRIWMCQPVTRTSSMSSRSSCCFWTASSWSMTARIRSAKSWTRRWSWFPRASAVRCSARLARLVCRSRSAGRDVGGAALQFGQFDQAGLVEVDQATAFSASAASILRSRRASSAASSSSSGIGCGDGDGLFTGQQQLGLQ